MKNTDFAWAAGFFDGEGTIQINEVLRADRKASFPFYLGATQVMREPLDKLATLFDGTVHYYDYTATNGSAFHVWRLMGADRVRFALGKMLPYLTVKREQAELMMTFCTHMLESPKCGRVGLAEATVAERRAFATQLKELRAVSRT